jgi:hypothetical protein
LELFQASLHLHLRPQQWDKMSLLLVAVIVRGKKTYKKVLPREAWNHTAEQIFRPDNVAVITRWPDSVQEQK